MKIRDVIRESAPPHTYSAAVSPRVRRMAEWGHAWLNLAGAMAIRGGDRDGWSYDRQGGRHLITLADPQAADPFVLFHELVHARQEERGEFNRCYLKLDWAGDIHYPDPAVPAAAIARIEATLAERHGADADIMDITLRQWRGASGPADYLCCEIGRSLFDPAPGGTAYYRIEPDEDLPADLDAVLARPPVFDAERYRTALPWEADANRTARRMAREYGQLRGRGA